MPLLFVFFAATHREKDLRTNLHPNARIDSIYIELQKNDLSLPKKEVFGHAMAGFQSLRAENRTTSTTISIIDFTLPSTDKRMWVIDLATARVLHHSLVAHGRNSGELYAREFSNKHDSYQSSLGFYLTGKTYMGKHGLSLKLHGVEAGINDHAEMRAIVIHGADYVDEQYAKKNGRLGRSWGCPAVPIKTHKEIIKMLPAGSCVFIYYPDQEYFSKSRYIGV